MIGCVTFFIGCNAERFGCNAFLFGYNAESFGCDTFGFGYAAESLSCNIARIGFAVIMQGDSPKFNGENMAQFTYDNGDFGDEVQKFIDAASGDPANYGTSTARLTGLQNLLSPFVATARELSDLITATEAKRAQLTALRAPLESDFRGERNDAYEHATDQQLIDGGLDPHKKPSKTTPTPPQKLMATGGADGVNRLKWEAGENGRTTEYVVFARIAQAPRAMIDVVRTLKFEHKGQTPGVTVIYDIEARRRDILSEPSNQAIVFGP